MESFRITSTDPAVCYFWDDGATDRSAAAVPASDDELGEFEGNEADAILVRLHQIIGQHLKFVAADRPD